MYVFTKHPSSYSSIKVELKAFVGDNWAEWKSDEPKWFTAKFIRKIPDYYIPEAALQALKDANGREKRRISLLEALGIDGDEGGGGGGATVTPEVDIENEVGGVG